MRGSLGALINRSAAIALVASGCLHLPARPEAAAELWGFTGPWDARSDSSVARNSPKLARVVTGWITFDTVSFMPVQLYADSLALAPDMRGRSMALLTSRHGNRFHPDIIRGLGQSPQALALAAGTLARLIEAGGYGGLVIDFEGMTAGDIEALLTVVRSFADSSRAHGAATVAIAVPAADTAAYPGALLLGAADLLMPLLYDQHWGTSAPGPISSPEWVRRHLGARVAEVGSNRIVAALPLYGYRWRRAAATEVIGFADAVRLSSMTNTLLTRDISSATLHATSAEGWEIWVTDAVLLRTLMRDARLLGVSTFALWRLGLEDPAVWGTTVAAP